VSYYLREQDFESFFQVPFEIYGNSHYVSPMKNDLRRNLDSEANPLLAKHGECTYFTCFSQNRPVGRIVALIHRTSNVRHVTKRCQFGFFDCVNDLKVAQMLLNAAAEWGRAKGMEELCGNFNLTAMQQAGVVTEGFENITFCDQLYGPDYLPSLLEKCGFTAFFPAQTSIVDLQSFEPETLVSGRVGEALLDDRYTFHTVNKKNLTWALEQARIALNAGFDKNPMFVPLTKEEFEFQCRDLSTVMDPRISVIATQGDRTLGAVVCIPDLNPLLKATKSRFKFTTIFHFLRFRFNRRRAVIIFYSVVPEFHGKGINGAMLYKTTKALKKYGYNELGVTWISEENLPSLRQIEKMGGRVLNRTHLFRKKL
tara:strand:- start:12590 stop:13696 length:1107 start_codon:yes stop_codon:yes gene_type:complete